MPGPASQAPPKYENNKKMKSIRDNNMLTWKIHLIFIHVALSYDFGPLLLHSQARDPDKDTTIIFVLIFLVIFIHILLMLLYIPNLGAWSIL
jgi:hypothetical protein